MNDDKTIIADNELDGVIVEDELSASDEATDDTSDEGEQSQGEGDVNLEDSTSTTETAKEEAARKQRIAWQRKIDEGKASISDAPNWLQGQLVSKGKIYKEVDVNELIENKLQEKLEEKEFQDLKSKLPPLKKAQADQLKAEFAELSGRLGKLKALKYAIKIAGVEMEEELSANKSRMKIPAASNVSAKKTSQKLASNNPQAIAQDEQAWRMALESFNSHKLS